jgi:hypothetical protein
VELAKRHFALGPYHEEEVPEQMPVFDDKESERQDIMCNLTMNSLRKEHSLPFVNSFAGFHPAIIGHE